MEGLRRERLLTLSAILLASLFLSLVGKIDAQDGGVYGFVMDASGDPSVANLYLFGTDGTSSAQSVASYNDVVVSKASTVDSKEGLYWTAVYGYPSNGIIAVNTAGDIVMNVSLTSSEIICLAMNPNGSSLAIVTKNGNQISVSTYYYSGSVVLEASYNFASYYPSGDCAFTSNPPGVLFTALRYNASSSPAFTPYLLSYTFESKQFGWTPLIGMEGASVWSVSGLQFDSNQVLMTMLNWDDDYCSLSSIDLSSGIVTPTDNVCSQQAAGGLLVDTSGSSDVFYTWLLAATYTVSPTTFATITNGGDTFQLTSIPTFSFSNPFFISAGFL